MEYVFRGQRHDSRAQDHETINQFSGRFKFPAPASTNTRAQRSANTCWSPSAMLRLFYTSAIIFASAKSAATLPVISVRSH
jgi:hypothetical protein